MFLFNLKHLKNVLSMLKSLDSQYIADHDLKPLSVMTFDPNKLQFLPTLFHLVQMFNAMSYWFLLYRSVESSCIFFIVVFHSFLLYTSIYLFHQKLGTDSTLLITDLGLSTRTKLPLYVSTLQRLHLLPGSPATFLQQTPTVMDLYLLY